MSAKYEIKKAKNSQYMFNLKAVNGEVILTSEMYKAKSGSIKGIVSVRKNALEDEQFERKLTINGRPYFVLKAKNGKIIGTSEAYSSKNAMLTGIVSVKANAQNAIIDDKTILLSNLKKRIMSDDLKVLSKTNHSTKIQAFTFPYNVTWSGSPNNFTVNTIAKIDFNIDIEVALAQQGTKEFYLVSLRPSGTLTVGKNGMVQNNVWCRGWFRREVFIEYGPVPSAESDLEIRKIDLNPQTINSEGDYEVRSSVSMALSLDPSIGVGSETASKVAFKDFYAAPTNIDQIHGWSYYLSTVYAADTNVAVVLTHDWDSEKDSNIRNTWLYSPAWGTLSKLPPIASDTLHIGGAKSFLSSEVLYRVEMPESGKEYKCPLYFGCAQNLWTLRSDLTHSGGASGISSVGGIVEMQVSNKGIEFGESIGKSHQTDLEKNKNLDTPNGRASSELDTLREKLLKELLLGN